MSVLKRLGTFLWSGVSGMFAATGTGMRCQGPHSYNTFPCTICGYVVCQNCQYTHSSLHADRMYLDRYYRWR